MLRVRLIGTLSIFLTPLAAHAQGVVAPAPIDPSTLPSKSDVATALSAAQAALAAATAAQAKVPDKCTNVPAMDTTNGAVGTGTPCTPAADSSRPTNVQIGQANATPGSPILTGSDGSFAGVWPRAWAAAPSYAHAEIYGSGLPYLCVVTTATITTVSGKCYQTVTTSLPGTLLALSQTIINPVANAPSGLTVRVVGRQ